jgi:hypothetical protein
MYIKMNVSTKNFSFLEFTNFACYCNHLLPSSLEMSVFVRRIAVVLALFSSKHHVELLLIKAMIRVNARL